MLVWAATAQGDGRGGGHGAMLVPMAVDTKAPMRNRPGRMKAGGTSERPKFTVASTLPMAVAVAAKPPASR